MNFKSTLVCSFWQSLVQIQIFPVLLQRLHELTNISGKKEEKCIKKLKQFRENKKERK
jgi:hypothetical protein